MEKSNLYDFFTRGPLFFTPPLWAFGHHLPMKLFKDPLAQRLTFSVALYVALMAAWAHG